MNGTLNRKQRVLVSSHISFQHSADSGRKHEVELTERQFLNLNDVIKNLDYYHSVHYFPLGGNVWLHRNSAVTEILDNRTNSFFWFYRKAWHVYITRVHAQVYAFLRDRKTYHYQPDADHESRPQHSPRGGSSHLSLSHKTLSRSARDAYHDYDKRTQSANVSRRKSSDSRPRKRCRRGKYASRIYREIKEDQQYNATGTSDDNDSIEFSDQCSIKEGSISPQDPID